MQNKFRDEAFSLYKEISEGSAEAERKSVERDKNILLFMRFRYGLRQLGLVSMWSDDMVVDEYLRHKKENPEFSDEHLIELTVLFSAKLNKVYDGHKISMAIWRTQVYRPELFVGIVRFVNKYYLQSALVCLLVVIFIEIGAIVALPLSILIGPFGLIMLGVIMLLDFWLIGNFNRLTTVRNI